MSSPSYQPFHVLKYWWVCLCCLYGGFVQAHGIALEPSGDKPVPVSSIAEYLLTEDSLGLEDLLSGDYDGEWESYDKEFFSMRASGADVWFRLDIQNLTGEDLWLEVGRSLACWEIDFYAADSLGVYGEPIRTGSLRPMENKAYPSDFFWLPLSKGSDTAFRTYYIRMRSDLTKEFPLYAGSLTALSQKEEKNQYLSVGFLGIMLALFCYNLFLYLSTRDHIYLHYIFYLSTSAFQCTLINGFPLIDSPLIYEHYIVSNNFLMFSISWFAIVYLRLKELLPSIHKASWAYTLVLVAVPSALNIMGFPLYKMNSLYNVLSMGLAFLLIGSGGYLWVKGHRHARLFVLGWTSAVLGLCGAILTIYGVLPRTLFTRNILYFGFGIEAVLFALALADRLNIMEREKRRVQEEMIGLVKNQNALLEEKVEERTEEIKRQQQEIVTQNEELQQQQEEVVAQRDFIEQQNKQLNYHNLRITDSIRYAQTIQEAVLPSKEQLDKTLRDYFVYFKPKDIVSGDFYWVFEGKDSLYIAVGDCTGHGVPGAFMSMIGMSLLNEIALAHVGISPKELLRLLNERINIALRQHQSENADGMDIAICQLFRGAQTRMVFSGAKATAYIQPEGGTMSFLKGERRSIGGLNRSIQDIEFSDQEVVLEERAMVYLFTDGIVDQGNSKGRKLGSKKLREHLSASAHREAGEQQKVFSQLLQSHSEDAVQRDDMTLLGFRV